MLDEWLKAVLLGIVEGVTEFLPISSTGHLIVGTSLLNFQPDLRVTFEIFIQIGAVVAVVAYYRDELLRQARGITTSREIQRLWRNIVVAILPAGVVGFAVREWVYARLFNPAVVAVALIIGGIVMMAVERFFGQDNGTQPESAHDSLQSVTLRQAVIVGLAQMVALIPGVSRSASSIIGGLIGGMSRRTATQFSFFLAIPTLGGVTLIELLTNIDRISTSQLGVLIVGAVVSAVVAWYAVGWLLRYVSRHSFVVFGAYRIAAGVVVLLMLASGLLSNSA